MTLRTLLAVILLGLSAVHAQAQQAADDHYRHVLDDFIRPGFAALAEEAKRHEADWAAYCQAPSPEGLAALASSFQSLADAWSEVGIIRYGPSSQDFRNERFAFWPERKNVVERGLAALLKHPEALDAATIRRQSAAVQGLPALERLLYADGQPDAGLGSGPEGEVRCAAGQVISANAAGLAAELAAGWAAAPGLVTQEVRAQLATDIVTAYAILKDQKIEAVIGKDEDRVRPHSAAFWRSGRTMRDISQTLSALAAVSALLFPYPPDDIALPHTTKTALAIAGSIDDLAATASNTASRNEAVLLRDAVTAAGDRAIIEVPLALGVTIGFNSLDGD